ncbi:cellulose binding domain-containing protein, partial [Sphaerisporangium sp. B11E5]|uniref:cellulose binding domain-containing protein n=1 Tax=Sphaerisporangium sp. B11E5 TaxID=3153563 RepID=UPI00325D2A58
PTPTPTPTVTPTPTPTPTAGTLACRVTYRVTSQWQGGFNGEVTIGLTSGSVTNWTLNFTWPGSQRISNAWNARVTQSGTQVTALDGGWNARVDAGGSATFGFSASGTSSPPAAYTFNGVNCAIG